MKYNNLPLRPDFFKEVKGIKADAERELGTKFDWNSFVLGLLGGAIGTGLGIAIGKAVRKYQQQKKGGGNP